MRRSCVARNSRSFRLHLVLFAMLLLCFSPFVGVARAGDVVVGELPPGWMERSPYHESIDRYFVYQEKGTVLAELLILEEFFQGEYTPEQYLEAVKTNSMPSFAEYAPLEDEPAGLHGRDAIIHRFHFSNGSEVLKAEVYVFVGEGAGYLFLFDTSDDLFLELQPEFRSFVENILRLPGATEPEATPEPVKHEPVTPEPVTPPEPVKPEPTPSPDTLPEFLPEDTLPKFKELEGFIRSDSETLLITLPEGAAERDREDEEVVLEGPDESVIVVALYENKEAAVRKLAKETKGMRKHGATTLDCGGTPVHTELYSERVKGEGSYAILFATWEQSGTVVAIRIPSSKYASAGAWVKEMLCSVEIIE